ncbi:hypothetical protein EB796_005227 [Bugula neritina]|uniref:Uncharacterized protein n=1 Tax=Bugula neritina TaxID=10212 RepID=A0A7J7KFQ2_BUGNE|nr:hypothetical protein EB796_005227 [Bugula neritina]
MHFYVAMTTQKQKANVYILYSAVQLCIFKRLIKTKNNINSSHDTVVTIMLQTIWSYALQCKDKSKL